MKILHLTFSPRHEGSHSTTFSQRIVQRLLARHPRAAVTRHDIGTSPLAHVDGHYGHVLSGSPGSVADAARPDGTLARSEALIVDLEQADAVVIGTPMHNYTVPSALKAWIDHVLRIHRSFAATPEGKVGLLADRPVYIAVSSGGLYLGPEARQPDFLTPYLEAVFKTLGVHDLTFFPLQALVRGPAAVDAAYAGAMHLLDQALPAA